MAPVTPSALGILSPRTVTLLLALLGILAHINLYTWLGTIRQTLPDVPERPYSLASTLQASSYGSAASLDQLAAFNAEAEALAAAAGMGAGAGAGAGAGVGGGIAVDAAKVSVPTWMAEAKAYLKAQGLNFVPADGIGSSDALKAALRAASPQGHGDAQSPSSSSAFAAVGSASRPSLPDIAPPHPPNHNDAAYSYALFDDGAEDAERLNWHAMRLVIGSFRVYALLCILCCCAGIVGVLRPSLLLSRVFVIHYFFDLLLITLSLGSIAILASYPTIRSQICDEHGNGQAISLFGDDTLSTLPSSTSSASSGKAAMLPGGQVDAPPSSWETMLDGIFTSENCEDAFTTTLVPIFLLVALIYTAARLYAFLCVQRFYTSLLRSRMAQYGYRGGDEMYMEARMQNPRDMRLKEDKLLD